MMKQQYVVVDFEMNPVAKANREVRGKMGLEIIEIGAVRLDESYTVVDKFRCFVRPQYNKEIASYITGLTGISRYETYNAPPFAEALRRFENWIGYDARTVVYSWSDSDLQQIRSECAFKQLPLPDNMGEWVDFQAMYASAMDYPAERGLMALHTAAEQFGIGMDFSHSHSALYDAEITTELLIPVLTGEYVRQAALLRGASLGDPEDGGCSIGDCCGGVLQELLRRCAEDRPSGMAS